MVPGPDATNSSFVITKTSPSTRSSSAVGAALTSVSLSLFAANESKVSWFLTAGRRSANMRPSACKRDYLLVWRVLASPNMQSPFCFFLMRPSDSGQSPFTKRLNYPSKPLTPSESRHHHHCRNEYCSCVAHTTFVH
jgi:hypothetical protein